MATKTTWTAFTAWVLPYLFIVLWLATDISRTGERTGDFIIFVGIVITSTGTDFLVIAASRLLLRRATTVRSAFGFFSIMIYSVTLAFIVFILPLILTISNSLDQHLHPDRRIYYRLCQGLWALNGSDFIFVLLLIFIVFILFGHHVFWPSIQRPLYSIQRTGVTASRKSAASIGIIMISTGLGFTPIIGALRKLMGI